MFGSDVRDLKGKNGGNLKPFVTVEAVVLELLTWPCFLLTRVQEASPLGLPLWACHVGGPNIYGPRSLQSGLSGLLLSAQ